MAAKSPDKIRNIAFAGHSTCGKTTLVESLLFIGGGIERKGSVDDGTSVCDYDDQEKERNHSIDLACASVDTQDTLLQFVDTPGYRDFIGQVYCATASADLIAVVICADEGIRPNTRKVWEIARDANLPCFVIINRVDREHSNFDQVLWHVQEQLDDKCLPMTAPNESGGGFSSVEDNLGNSDDLMESIIESNDELMERYLEGEEIGSEEIAAQCVAAVGSRGLFPVYATSSLNDSGVKELIDGFIRYSPSAAFDQGREHFNPADEEDTQAVSTVADAPFAARVFRVVSDPFVGKLSYLRIFSGSISQGGSFLNPNTGKQEKVGKLIRFQGKDQDAVEQLGAGEIGALIKVEGLQTFDYLNSDSVRSMTSPSIPLPMSGLATTPKTKADEKKFAESFVKLVEEDVCLTSKRDDRTGELVISGVSSLHLQILWERLKSRYGVEVATQLPKTPYLETISAKGDAQYRHKKQSGGSGEFAEVWLRVEPTERGSGLEFVNSIFGGAISQSYVQSVEKGITAMMKDGVLAGCEFVDIKVEVYDGKEHPVDSKDVAFQKAGRGAFKLAVNNARPVLLEPIVNLEVSFPSEYTGDIQGDVTRRRGRVQGVDAQGDFQTIKALVPLAELTDYAGSLGSATGGQGAYTIEMAHYETVPGNLQQKVIEAYNAERNQED